MMFGFTNVDIARLKSRSHSFVTFVFSPIETKLLRSQINHCVSKIM